jgi:UDP-glucuronate decarboxylase
MTINPIIKEDLENIYNSDIDWTLFRNATILITGANGFLPAYLVEFFLFLDVTAPDLNIRVIGLVRSEEKSRLRFKDYLHYTNFKLIFQDVCDQIKIDEKVDYIIHAASQASPKFYGKDPVGTIYPNVLGTINLLNFSRLNNVKSFLYFSSGEVYGKVDSNKIDENNYGYLDPTDIRSCYGESKRMGENLCVSYLYQYNINVKIVRPFHTYGPGMSLDDGRVFADFVKCIINKQDIILNSDGSAKRAFCYLSDATIGFIKVLLHGATGEAYNIGNPREETSIINLAHTLISLFPDYNLNVRLDLVEQNNGYVGTKIQNAIPNISKLQKIGWNPKISLIEGFKRTIKSFL